MSLWFNHRPDGFERSGGVVKIRIVSRLKHTFAPLCYYKNGMLILFNWEKLNENISEENMR